MSPVAKRIPTKIKKCSDAAEQRKKELARACFIKMVDWCHRNEAYCPTLWNYIETGTIKFGDDSTRSGFFASPPKTLKVVDKAWRAQWLIGRSGGSLSSQLLQRIDSVDECAIFDMFCLFTGTQGTEQLPKEFVEQDLLAAACDSRYASVHGVTLQTWVTNCIDARSGVVDWMAGGAYQFEFTDYLLTKVQHWRGETVMVPEAMHVTKSFELKHPAIDTQACFVSGPVTHIIAKLFSAKKGPHEFAFDKKGKQMQELLAIATQSLQAKKSASSRLVQAEGSLVLTDHAKEKRSAALAKARAKVIESGASSEKKGRVLKLADI